MEIFLIMKKQNIFTKLLFFISIIVVLTINPIEAHAQESAPDIRQIFNEQRGEFDISISIQPSVPVVGRNHITFTIRDIPNLEPVDSVKVVLTATHDEEDSIQVQAVNEPNSPENYHANLTVIESGEWLLLIDIKKTGFETVNLEIPVLFGEPPLPSNQAGSLLWIIVFLSLIGGILFLWNRSRNISRTDSIVYRK